MVIRRVDVERYSRVVDKQKIRDNDYNLNIPRYVDSSEPAESWDLYASMFGGIPNSELDTFNVYWQAFPQLRQSLFDDGGTPYSTAQIEDFAQAIAQHPSVLAHQTNFQQQFASLPCFLSSELIDNAETLNIHQQQEQLAQNIFNRLQSVALIDKYQAYQLLADQWEQIAIDLEILQTEGMQAVCVVEPNMVTKKVKGVDAEVQEGWKGRVLPFELVQNVHLSSVVEKLTALQNRLDEIQAGYAETLEELDEEDKDSLSSSGVLNDDGDRWVNAGINREAKALQAEQPAEGYTEDSLEARIIQLAEWVDEERALRRGIKDGSEALHLLTKQTLENLSAEQANELLEAKWITPLIEQLHQLARQPVATLSIKLQALADKYSITFADNARAIAEAEQELAAMTAELVGNEFDMKGLAELQSLLLGKGR